MKKSSVYSDMYLNGAILKLFYYYSTQESVNTKK